MRRFLLAIPLLLTMAVSSSDAGYLVVRIILEGGGGGSAGDAMSGPGGLSGSGGYNPYGGGSMGGMGGMGGMPGGFGGLKPPGGMGGSSLGPPGGGSASGPPGGMVPGMPGGGGSPQGQGAATDDPTRSVVVIVPFTKSPGKRDFYKKNSSGNKWDFGLTHPLGSTNVLIGDPSIQIYTDLGRRPSETKTIESDIHFRHGNWPRTKDAQILFDLIVEALENGMVTDAVAYSDELLIAVDEKKVKTSPPVERFAAAYRKIQKPLQEAPGQASDAAIWKSRLDPSGNDTQMQTRGHYSIVFWDSGKNEIDRRFAQLDENFKAFFLWYATRGIALPIPQQPLVAVLPKTGHETIRIARAVDGTFTGADAFYSPDYDLLVLSPERLDGVGVTFQKQVRQIYQGTTRQSLIHGEGPILTPHNPNAKPIPNSMKPDEVARMQTWAMVDRYLEEEAEISGVSREATRQLYYVAGLLPRHVVLPNWLSNGSVSFFHRPKGPVFTTKDDKKNYITVALTTGYGGPNYVLHKYWRELEAKKELNPDSAALLRNVVTDAYFTSARDMTDIDPPPPIKPAAVLPPGVPPPPPEAPIVVLRRKQEVRLHKAYATAWALYYYLVKNHPEGLQRYFAELNRLPRDIPLDESTRLAAFSRAFNLTTPDAFAAFSRSWVQSVHGVPLTSYDIKLTEPPPAPAGSGAGPGGMPPGGMPGLGKPGGG